MKNALKMACLAGLGLSLLQVNAAEEQPPLKDQKEKVSYAVGLNIGQNIKRSGFEVDLDLVSSAMKDVLGDKPGRMTEQEAREVLTAYQNELRAKREAERKVLAEKNRAAGQAFLEENKKKPGVKIIPVAMPDGTTVELQYKVITEGTGPIPASNDTVKVHYKGTLTNGKEFDSSAKHGPNPAQFQANRVIRGWTEALTRMKAGSKWELYIPAQLAYGDFGSGPTIEPGSTLIFEVELLGSEAPPPAPTAQPLTSDIIKVPSAEELKKGAKVEVLKAEDVERQLRAATNKPAGGAQPEKK